MITITPTAAQHIHNLILEKQASKNSGLRLSIEQGGCAGLQYSMTLAPQQTSDIIIEQDGAHLFIDANSASQLDGCTLDYEDGLTGSGFRVINPKAVRSCGCGTSFEPKKD